MKAFSSFEDHTLHSRHLRMRTCPDIYLYIYRLCEGFETTTNTSAHTHEGTRTHHEPQLDITSQSIANYSSKHRPRVSA